MLRGVAGVAFGTVMAATSLSTAAASPTAATLREGGFALAPFSFVKFCLDYPGDCPKSAGPGRIRLTAAHMAELASVNRAVNAAIRPTPDTSAMRFWKLNVSVGDCNAFAVEKRHQLIARGWPAAALALTVVKTSWGEGHLVVTVRTDQGDLVLDSLRSAVIAWQKTGYDWIMRQSEANPQFWVDLDGGEAGTMTAAADFGAPVEVAEATNPIASDATTTRPAVAAERVPASDARLKRAGAESRASVQVAKVEAPKPPVRETVKAVAAATPNFEQAAVPRSPDVVGLEADVANAALEQAARLATTTVDLGFASAAAPRSPDVARLEAEAAALKLEVSQSVQASDPAMAALPRWLADVGQEAASFANHLAAAFDLWRQAGETASAPPTMEVARQAPATESTDIGLRGFL
jgi:predicted transglutaminase-like cysteine proteinase